MRAFIPISALALALGSGAALAGGHDNERHGGSAAAQFESLDRNSDQRLSKSEAAEDREVSDKFAALDADGDGYVTEREYTARLQEDQQSESPPMRDEQSPPMNQPPEDNRQPYGGLR